MDRSLRFWVGILMMQSDPSTPISGEAVEAAARAIEVVRDEAVAGRWPHERASVAYARAALEAAAPFMEGHALYRSQRAKTAAAEAKAATLAAQIEAVRELAETARKELGILNEGVSPTAVAHAWRCLVEIHHLLGSTETREGDGPEHTAS
jgi:hypothetical protein